MQEDRNSQFLEAAGSQRFVEYGVVLDSDRMRSHRHARAAFQDVTESSFERCPLRRGAQCPVFRVAQYNRAEVFDIAARRPRPEGPGP